ncbi:MAG: DNA/RNA nuclease SfsA [Lachnospiraceae bacterium]|nr:DNA/RNA nuclease SfsA [Lachnospiraceae bacterium]
MKYEHTVWGTFVSRPNRFIAKVLINGREETCHVKNTGRCRELLVPGARLVLEHHPDAETKGRKTSYDVIGVCKEHAGNRDETLLINMDSQAPNEAAWEWVCAGGPAPKITQIRREVTYGNSRFDLAFLLNGHQAFMEVKGVTLERQGIAAFPDAPTQRGIKHLEELAAASRQGIPCFLLLVIQMKGITSFRPNMETHPEFGHALAQAKKDGVTILAYDCLVTETEMAIDQPVPVDLTEVLPVS